MKNKILISAFCFLLSAFAATAQLTNSVKVSALPSATLPLAGTELVPIVQQIAGTNASRTATVDQLLAKATALDNATTNGLAALLTAETTSRTVAVSNALALSTNFNTAQLAALVGTNNILLAAINAEIASRQVAVSNALVLTTNNYTGLLSALVGTNSALAGQIATLAASIGQSITNGGTVTFTRANITSLVNPSVNLGTVTQTGGTSTNHWLDFSAGTIQRLTLDVSGGGAPTMLFAPTNAADGQQICLWLSSVRSVSAGSVTRSDIHGASTIGPTTSGQNILMNWVVVGTSIIYCGGTIIP